VGELGKAWTDNSSLQALRIGVDPALCYHVPGRSEPRDLAGYSGEALRFPIQPQTYEGEAMSVMFPMAGAARIWSAPPAGQRRRLPAISSMFVTMLKLVCLFAI